MVIVRRALPMSLILLVGIAGCANVSGVASTVASRPLPLPLPPHEACAYPSSQELLSLAAASDVVVEAAVVEAAQSGSIGNSYFWTYRISGGRVLGGKPTAKALLPTTVVETGGPRNVILPVGRYIMFLTDSDGWFTLTDGMKGRFPISSSGLALRECPNYLDPAHPLIASGAPVSISQFEQDIPTILPPRASLSK